jgi:hypothetical protein
MFDGKRLALGPALLIVFAVAIVLWALIIILCVRVFG